MKQDNKKSSSNRWLYMLLLAGVIIDGTAILAQGINLSNTDGWINITNVNLSTNATYVINFNTTKPTVASFYADANNSGTLDTTLYLVTVPAITLTDNGDSLSYQYAGNTSGCTGTVSCRFRYYLNNTLVYDSGAVALSGDMDWTISGAVIRANSSSARITTFMQTEGASTFDYSEIRAVDIDWSKSVTMNLTGTSSGVGAASNQISAKMGWVSRR